MNWLLRKLLEIRVAWHEATLFRLIQEQSWTRCKLARAHQALEDLKRLEERDRAVASLYARKDDTQ